MSNCSSSSDALLRPSFQFFCYFTKPNSYIFTSYVIMLVLLLLPLCLYVLHQGLRQWMKPSSSSSSSAAAASVSHSDCFAYHLSFFEVVGVVGNVSCLCALYMDDHALFLVGFHITTFTWFGEIYFHVLTCVERHVAVVHPIAYMRLRSERGVRVRNVAVGCVWFLSLAGVWVLTTEAFLVLDLIFLFSGLSVVSFCSLSVLWALIGPGPGERGGKRVKVDQSKQRAFYTIVAILAVLLLKFSWNLNWGIRHLSGSGASCEILSYEMWFNLPSSLVLPLLFLHRQGNCLFCR